GRETSVEHQSVGVLHQGMPHEAELGLFARPLAIEPRLWIGSRGVGVVRALLTVKSASRFRPSPSAGGSSEPSFGLKLFIDAQASINVPSTEKCSVLRSRFTRGCARTVLNSLAAMSPSNRRSRFLEKTE